MVKSLWLRVVGLAVLLLCLGGCFPARLPTQSKPSCSWTTQPPAQAERICTITFQTLRSVVSAEAHGDDANIRRLVVNRAVAKRIIAYGRVLRAQRAVGLHVVPSFTMEAPRPGRLGAGFFIVGTGRRGKIHSLEQVYLRIENGSAVIVGDEPRQEW